MKSKKILAGALVFASIMSVGYSNINLAVADGHTVMLSESVKMKLDKIIMKIKELPAEKQDRIAMKIKDRLASTNSELKKKVFAYVLENMSVDVAKGNYMAYSASALSSEKDNVLFFHASWCPSCRSADKNLMEDISSIPDDLQVLKIDYDANKDLRKKYGVTSQHTFVQVDENGNLIKKWSGGNSVDSIVKKVEKETSSAEIKLASAGTYGDYMASKLSSDKDNVLFFHASWCPSCRGADKRIMGEKDSIPANLQIMKLDYDDNKELRKKYGVTSQHTFVQVDENGNLIKKWAGGSSVDSIIKKID